MATTLAPWLAEIDPDPEAWEDKGLNRYWHKESKQQYDSGDMVNYMIREYNRKQEAEGKPRFIAGIHPVPDEIRPQRPDSGPPVSSTPPRDTSNVGPITHRPGTGTGGGGQPPQGGGTGAPLPGGGGGGNPYLPGLNPGFTWNPSGGAGGDPMSGDAAFGAGPTWDEGPGGGGQAGPVRTGLGMPFKPYGTIEDYSSEILRYGGAPASGNQGRWSGIDQPTGMRSIGGAAPPAAGVKVPGFTPNTYQAGSPGGGYQNIIRSPKDGTTWTDPSNGQTYVWRNGAYHKADLKNRTGPVKETPVTNRGGRGTADDPIRIDIGDDLADPALLAELLRQSAR